MASDHLLNFLDNFYKTWPTLKQSPLYITGESFGGHYVPAFARKIIINETWTKNTGVKLAGISIGDGWTDPMNQVNYYDSFLWSVGIVDTKFRDVCTWFQTHAMINIHNGNYKNVHFVDIVRPQLILISLPITIQLRKFILETSQCSTLETMTEWINHLPKSCKIIKTSWELKSTTFLEMTPFILLLLTTSVEVMILMLF
jgi:hypothetical protein